MILTDKIENILYIIIYFSVFKLKQFKNFKLKIKLGTYSNLEYKNYLNTSKLIHSI